jgi:nucleotide-binding universal stress UspA family protein
VTEPFRGRYVVAGVTPQQPPIVVQCAARFARQFDAVLVCANVEAANYVVAEHPDGSVESRPMDPDAPDWDTAVFDGSLAARVRDVAREAGVEVEFRELAGNIGHALGRLAEVLNAEMIIVGSRRGGGMRTSMHEFFGGSVAVHLAHRQPRPLVIIPLSPKPQGRLPWEHHA